MDDTEIIIQVMSKNPLEIVCRIAPTTGEEACVIPNGQRHVKLVPPKDYVSRNGEQVGEKEYRFAYVLGSNEPQNTVFTRCAIDMIEDLFAGSSGLIFAYGITGSGKTFTITGKADNENSGILPRSLDAIFKGVNHGLVEKYIFKPDGRNGFYVQNPSDALLERETYGQKFYQLSNKYSNGVGIRGLSSELCCSVFVSYVEIYNDVAYDLFDDSNEKKIKQIRVDHITGSAYVEGIIEIEVQSTDEVMEHYLRAQENRKVAETTLNCKSSRAHSIFTVRLVTASCSENIYPTNDIHIADLVIVDLAGSERAKRTGNGGDRLFEASKINQSLLTLRQCFEKLRENKRRRDPLPIPYRDCKLTHLFKSFFEGRGRIRMIICVNPRASDYDENVLVMKFAELAKEAKIVAPRPAEFGLEELGNLPFSFRELQQWKRELHQSVGKMEPLIMHLFNEAPVIELGGYDDDESIYKMRDYFSKLKNLRNNFNDTIMKNNDEFFNSLKHRLCVADLIHNKLNSANDDLEELRRTNEKIAADRNHIRRENDALKLKLAKYEVEYANDRRREEEENIRARQASAVYEKHRSALQEVSNLLNHPPIVSTPVGTGHVAQLRKQLDGDMNSRSEKPRVKTRSQSRTHGPKITSTTPASSRTNAGYVNKQHNRRSRSAQPGGRVLDHQPTTKVPSGSIFQPTLPKNTKRTTRPSEDDLKSCTDYVLNKQIVDSRGNLRTDLYKGKVLPTAGGGSAVMFDDVEILTHESPM